MNDMPKIQNFNDFLNWLLGNYQRQIDNATPISWLDRIRPILILGVIAFIIFVMVKK